MWLGLAPEGTRSAGAAFKSGFYRIAQAAGVPVVPISIDHLRRVITVHAPRAALDDVDQGVEAIRALLLASGRRRGESAPAG
jgi:1-acyl-sn-glycerol-3-phosphate acyltransferase